MKVYIIILIILVIIEIIAYFIRLYLVKKNETENCEVMEVIMHVQCFCGGSALVALLGIMSYIF